MRHYGTNHSSYHASSLRCFVSLNSEHIFLLRLCKTIIIIASIKLGETKKLVKLVLLRSLLSTVVVCTGNAQVYTLDVIVELSTSGVSAKQIQIQQSFCGQFVPCCIYTVRASSHLHLKNGTNAIPQHIYIYIQIQHHPACIFNFVHLNIARPKVFAFGAERNAAVA